MKETSPSLLLQQLLHRDGTYVLCWIKDAWAGKEHVPDDFNWHGLAEAAAIESMTQDQLIWAQVAVLIYDWLAIQESEGTCSPFAHSAMRIRGNMIRQYGPRPDDLVLDLDRVILWVSEGVSLPLLEAVQISAAVKGIAPKEKHLHIAELRQLRELKNRLAVLRGLPLLNSSPLGKSLEAWLAIRDDLP